jgi:hypothetical protein
MADRLLPIVKYQLSVHEPTEWRGEARPPDASGTVTLPAFNSRTEFVSSSDPIPIPRIGEEFELDFGDAPQPDAIPHVRAPRVIRRVRHRISMAADGDGLISRIDVYT